MANKIVQGMQQALSHARGEDDEVQTHEVEVVREFAETSTLSADQSEATALLIRARSLLERGWCRGVPAIDAEGWMVHPVSEKAIAWCASGALIAAGWCRTDLDHPAIHRLSAAMDGSICGFNDRQESVEPILAAFDRAIAGEPAARIAGEPPR
jgi:hypothetical protein